MLSVRWRRAGPHYLHRAEHRADRLGPAARIVGPVTGTALDVRAGVPVIAAGQDSLQQPGADRGQRGAHRLLQDPQPAPGARLAASAASLPTSAAAISASCAPEHPGRQPDTIAAEPSRAEARARSSPGWILWLAVRGSSSSVKKSTCRGTL